MGIEDGKAEMNLRLFLKISEFWIKIVYLVKVIPKRNYPYFQAFWQASEIKYRGRV